MHSKLYNSQLCTVTITLKVRVLKPKRNFGL